MKRVLAFKEKVIELEQLLNTGYPRYRFDRDTSMEISQKITELKDFASQLTKQLKKQYASGELTEFEIAFIEPAISDSYMKGIDKIRRGAKPSQSVYDNLQETLSTLDYWILHIEDYQNK
ncbi:hypothetical protein AB7200_06310 [Providencia alcalifaciens]|uniref:hypothetical protein n=1 Tax=Providencia manganoxydans TaxID=2923283 RepID=UPI0034E42240